MNLKKGTEHCKNNGNLTTHMGNIEIVFIQGCLPKSYTLLLLVKAREVYCKKHISVTVFICCCRKRFEFLTSNYLHRAESIFSCSHSELVCVQDTKSEMKTTKVLFSCQLLTHQIKCNTVLYIFKSQPVIKIKMTSPGLGDL